MGKWWECQSENILEIVVVAASFMAVMKNKNRPETRILNCEKADFKLIKNCAGSDYFLYSRDDQCEDPEKESSGPTCSHNGEG